MSKQQKIDFPTLSGQLAGSALFSGCTSEEINQLLPALRARRMIYEKGETVLPAGEPVREIGLVLTGSVRMENVDIWGHVSLLGRAEAGDIFAEAYALSPGEPLMVQVTAGEQAEILFLSAGGLADGLPGAGKVVRGLLALLARKSLALSRRTVHTAPKTIREKLLSYLSDQALQAGRPDFSIPFNRQQLADYLGVDRSALSGELSKMRREGILEYRKNAFVLKQAADWT